jgi:hypothetical protein
MSNHTIYWLLKVFKAFYGLLSPNFPRFFAPFLWWWFYLVFPWGFSVSRWGRIGIYKQSA